MRALSSGKAAAPKQPQRRCFIFKTDEGKDEGREFCTLNCHLLVANVGLVMETQRFITIICFILSSSRENKDRASARALSQFLCVMTRFVEMLLGISTSNHSLFDDLNE